MSRERTRFVGREDELARVRDAIGSGASVVTLHGPPGSGKSRLARRLARELSAREVDLTDTHDVAGLVARIAGMSTPDPGSGVALIVDALAPDSIVVLDPFEHLATSCTPMLEALLDAAPGLQLIVATRERPRIAGEVTVPIGPLDPGDAVDLFLDRARAIAPSRTFARADVEALVERIDRLPLAIELLAARSLVLSPREQLAQLPNNLLGGALEASLATLDEELRARWAALGVFRGGFTLAAAEAVAGATADDLDRLARSALIEPRDAPSGTRFELLAILRDEAERRAPARVRERHAAFFAERASEGERENLIATFEYTTDPRTLVRLAVALDPLLVTGGPFELHRRVLLRALAVEDSAADRDRAALLRAHARFLGLRGHHGEAYEILHRARALSRAAGDEHGEALCDQMTAFHARALGRPRETLAAGERARDAGIRFGDRVLEGLGEQMVAFAEHALGHREEAYQRTRRVAAIARVAGSPRMLGIALANATNFALKLGRRDEARACYAEAADAMERAGDRLHRAKLSQLGALLAETLDEREAALELAIAELTAIGDAQTEAHARLELAAVGLARGDLRFAERALDGAREAVSRADDVELRVRADVVAAQLSAARGDGVSLEPLIAFCEERGLMTLANEAREVGPHPQLTVRTLVVARDGRAFALGGRRVELGRRGAAKRILLALTEQRGSRPGEAMTVHDVFTAGWPGERAIGTSGNARVYMAIRALRALGLEGALLTRDDGYLLDPHLDVSIADEI